MRGYIKTRKSYFFTFPGLFMPPKWSKRDENYVFLKTLCKSLRDYIQSLTRHELLYFLSTCSKRLDNFHKLGLYEQGSADWLEAKDGCTTGSICSQHVGHKKYAGPIAAAEELTMTRQEMEAKFSEFTKYVMSRGRELEPEGLKKYT